MTHRRTAAVLGAGSWGTALAIHLARAGHEVRLWARDPALVDDMQARRANAVYLPDVTLPDGVHVTASIEEALHRARLVVAAVPSHGTRSVLRRAARFVADEATVVSATKGLEAATLQRPSQIIAEELDGRHRPIVVLSGPSFAAEVARQLPTAICAASEDAAAAERVQEEFRSRYFRLYASNDVAGVEIGGAMKNVIAIAAGAVEGLGLGQNALAALITRGLAEISRLACAVGGQRDTLAGLSGLGDLVLTCTGTLSRNRHVGVELARGRRLEDVLASMKMIAEGVRTTDAALALGARCGVELPITEQIADVLAGRRGVPAAVEELMLRRQRAEAETG
ncbi:MAG: NAD(P)-dependent glycerol-3-phosphate dehydrogenase [Acidobacteriota bacterium]|nr:NAD(P)-dependent glycerol-3-phosphate dehydrogenase [Acidobacteriota bacterium]